jgi:NADP-dependent aldehyde dehydrogenase
VVSSASSHKWWRKVRGSERGLSAATRISPNPDLRSMLRPLGPAMVFVVSNFPLAFSVLEAIGPLPWAAGNPVIVKVHPAHPGTSELVGRSIRTRVRECGLHEGVFILLFGSHAQVDVALVTHPLVKAVGFPGSRTSHREK